MTLDHPDPDDGATENVERQPRRKGPKTGAISDAVAAPVGGKMARMRAAAASSRKEYATLRAQSGKTKVSLPHLALFGVLWRLWAGKRAEDTGSPGVSIKEVAEAAERPEKEVQWILQTLKRSGLIRSVRTSVGWAGNRVSYLPTELGNQIWGVAQVLGPGASLQVGRTATAWGSRAKYEPENFFRHAAFLRGNV